MLRGIIYLNIGERYAVPLIVSLASLRKFSDAPVAIICDRKTGYSISRRIAADGRLWPIDIYPQHEIKERYLESPSWIYQYKTKLPAISPFSETLILDSDTVIVGPIDELWPQAPNQVVLAARYGGRHQNLKMRLRCQQWSKIDARRANRARDRKYPWPVINTGIMAFGPETQDFQAEWRRFVEARPIHSCDEQSAQLLYPDFPHRIVDRRFNASVSFDRTTPDVRIWHGVGNSFYLKGKDIWLEHFSEAATQNIAGIRELLSTMRWTGQMMRHLRKWK